MLGPFLFTVDSAATDAILQKNMASNEWLRGKVIQMQNLIISCLCHFGKVKYIENNIRSLKIARLINQHIFFHFHN